MLVVIPSQMIASEELFWEIDVLMTIFRILYTSELGNRFYSQWNFKNLRGV